MSASGAGPAGLRPARRSVVKGAAWAVPAIVVASAAPALAASEESCVITNVAPRLIFSQDNNQVLIVFDPSVPVTLPATVWLERGDDVHQYEPSSRSTVQVIIAVPQNTLPTGVYDVRLQFGEGPSAISCRRLAVLEVADA